MSNFLFKQRTFPPRSSPSQTDTDIHFMTDHGETGKNFILGSVARAHSTWTAHWHISEKITEPFFFAPKWRKLGVCIHSWEAPGSAATVDILSHFTRATALCNTSLGQQVNNERCYVAHVHSEVEWARQPKRGIWPWKVDVNLRPELRRPGGVAGPGISRASRYL
jgi:hypothetical protein